MQPNANSNVVDNAPQAATPQTTPVNQGNMVTQSSKSKKNTGMIIGMAILAVLAAGGIGFGVWAFLSGNQKEAKLNEQISELNSRLTEQESVAIDNVVVDGYQNPVIKSTNPDEVFSMTFQSSFILTQEPGVTKRVDIRIENGTISDCSVFSRTGENAWQLSSQCAINGIEGEIYKVVEIGRGQENSGDKIGFIMTNGEVLYLSLYDFGSSDNAGIQGSLNVDGNVVDALTVSVIPAEGVGGYGTTVLVFDDGTYVEYNESMLN